MVIAPRRGWKLEIKLKKVISRKKNHVMSTWSRIGKYGKNWVKGRI